MVIVMEEYDYEDGDAPLGFDDADDATADALEQGRWLATDNDPED